MLSKSVPIKFNGYKCTFVTDGTLAKEGSLISIRVSFYAIGSEGGHGKYPPLAVLLKCLAF